jgi:hypothetical protein
MKTRIYDTENQRIKNWRDLSLDLSVEAAPGSLYNGFIDCSEGLPSEEQVIEDMILEGRATKGCLPDCFQSELSCVELPSNVLPFCAASEQGRLLAFGAHPPYRVVKL